MSGEMTPRDSVRKFDQHFTLCYKFHPASNLWVCESGYDSVATADVRAMELKIQHSEVTTALFPYKYYTPNVVQYVGIRSRLTPKVIVLNKKVF